MKQFSTKEVFSIPNLMGYFRILLIPLFCYLYIAKGGISMGKHCCSGLQPYRSV